MFKTVVRFVKALVTCLVLLWLVLTCVYWGYKGEWLTAGTALTAAAMIAGRD